MENFRESIKAAEASCKVVEKFRKPLGQALIKYAEKYNISEVELYVLIKNLMSDMEDANPTFKMASNVSDNIGEMLKNVMDMCEEVKDEL